MAAGEAADGRESVLRRQRDGAPRAGRARRRFGRSGVPDLQARPAGGRAGDEAGRDRRPGEAGPAGATPGGDRHRPHLCAQARRQPSPAAGGSEPIRGADTARAAGVRPRHLRAGEQGGRRGSGDRGEDGEGPPGQGDAEDAGPVAGAPRPDGKPGGDSRGAMRPRSSTSARKPDHRTRVGHARSERMKVRILAAALEVFAEKGPEAPVVDDFVRAAGIARGTFYNHFQSVEELLESTSIWTIESAVQAIDHSLRGVSGPALRFGTGIRLFLASAEANPVWCRFVARVWKLGALEIPRRDLRDG